MKRLFILAAALAATTATSVIPMSSAIAQRGGPGRATMTYLAKAGAGDMFEIQSSQMAVQHATSPRVREFAQMLVADHTRTTQMIGDAARADGITPPPPALMPAQRMMLRQLERARPRDFDRLYLSQQIPAHQQALAMHRDFARMGRGPALRRVAGGAVPVVQHHLSEARMLSRMR